MVHLMNPVSFEQDQKAGSFGAGTFCCCTCAVSNAILIILRFTGPPVPITARVHSTPQRTFPFSHPVFSSPLSATALPLGPANITHRSVCLGVLHRLHASCSASLVLFIQPNCCRGPLNRSVCPCPSRTHAPVFRAPRSATLRHDTVISMHK
eukprot:8680730-Pyramimonas_sp.AAC.1